MLGLVREETRDRDVVLAELTEPHLVELHQPPRPALDTQGEQEERVHRELTQDERLGRIDVAVQERHRPRLAAPERLRGQREVRDPVRGLVTQRDLTERVLRGIHEVLADDA